VQKTKIAPTRAANDPDGRRRQILAATIEVIAEVGVTKATHRLIAARAEVPLGATTYYFPTLTDLVDTAIDAVAESTLEYVESWDARLRDSSDLVETLGDLAEEYVSDRSRSVLEYEIYVAAARNEKLGGIAAIWREGVPAMLEHHMDAPSARATSTLLAGSMLEAVASGLELDRDTFTFALGRILGTPTATPGS
jgi:DNA-binding transcriptional regulator YbjK